MPVDATTAAARRIRPLIVSSLRLVPVADAELRPRARDQSRVLRGGRPYGLPGSLVPRSQWVYRGLVLIGRDAATARIDELLLQGRGGRSGALLVRGEAGIGKTALLD